jgi:uncharacterized membrane protein YraQ (UPF0718 family)
LLGPVFAVFRPLVAFITGILGGALVDVFTPNEEHQQENEPCSDECCDPTQKASKIKRGLKYAFITLPRDIGKAMLIGLIVAAVITAFVPDDFFAKSLPATGIFAMLVMVVLGVPVYVCATASVPVAAALIAKGLAPGVALVFLITGPATNAASFITILKVLGARTAVIYLLSVIVCAIAAGLTLDAMYPDLGVSVQSHVHQMSPSVIGHLSAAALLTVLAFAILYKPKNAH